MLYRVFNPTPPLEDVVEHYWYSRIELNAAVIQHYPTPLLQGLTFNFHKRVEHHAYDNQVITLSKQAYLFGQPTGSRMITTNEKGVDILGVKFKPLGISKITGINMAHMANAIIAAEDIWGPEFESLCDEMQSAGSLENTIQVLEKFLLHKHLHTSLHYRIENVEQAISLISRSSGEIAIKELQYKTNTSRKTMERAFFNYLGLSPKLYSQIVRFNEAKAWMDKRIAKQPILDIAFDFGYYDGSHFAAEFKRFSGLNPSEYIRNRYGY